MFKWEETIQQQAEVRREEKNKWKKWGGKQMEKCGRRDKETVCMKKWLSNQVAGIDQTRVLMDNCLIVNSPVCLRRIRGMDKWGRRVKGAGM